MSTDINSIILIGRMVRDPEIKQVNNTDLASFSLASNKTYKHNGEKREEVLFVDCTVWGKLADVVGKYCKKGKQVCVSGRLKQEIWQNNDGAKQSKILINVESLQMLGGGSQNNTVANPQPNQYNQPEHHPVAPEEQSGGYSAGEGGYSGDRGVVL